MTVSTLAIERTCEYGGGEVIYHMQVAGEGEMRMIGLGEAAFMFVYVPMVKETT